MPYQIRTSLSNSKKHNKRPLKRMLKTLKRKMHGKRVMKKQPKTAASHEKTAQQQIEAPSVDRFNEKSWLPTVDKTRTTSLPPPPPPIPPKSSIPINVSYDPITGHRSFINLASQKILPAPPGSLMSIVPGHHAVPRRPAVLAQPNPCSRYALNRNFYQPSLCSILSGSSPYAIPVLPSILHVVHSAHRNHDRIGNGHATCRSCGLAACNNGSSHSQHSLRDARPSDQVQHGHRHLRRASGHKEMPKATSPSHSRSSHQLQTSSKSNRIQSAVRELHGL